MILSYRGDGFPVFAGTVASLVPLPSAMASAPTRVKIGVSKYRAEVHRKKEGDGEAKRKTTEYCPRCQCEQCRSHKKRKLEAASA